MESILKAALAKGVRRWRLRILMTGLRVRYLIRHLSLQPQGNRKYAVVIRNSPPIRLLAHAVKLVYKPAPSGKAEHEARFTPGVGGSFGTFKSASARFPTARASLAKGGYDTLTDPDVAQIGITAERPLSANIKIRQALPKGGLRRLEKSLVPKIASSAGTALGKIGALGRVEERLVRGQKHARSWHAGHLVPNSLGGPAREENLVPQAAAMNVGGIAWFESWVKEQWLRVKGKKPRATVTYRSSAGGRGLAYRVQRPAV